MVFPVVGGNESKGYDVENSLRFNDGDSPRLTRTPSSAGNRRTFTLSVWFKLTVSPSGDSNYERQILAADDGTGGNNNFDYIAINNLNKIFLYNYEGGEAYVFTSTQLLRDPSAWYHLVVAFDTTQGTNTNRVKIYLNGNQITDFDTANYPSQNHQTRFNNNNAHRIGSYPDQDTQYFDGYMCEYHLVDGSQLAPTSFGEFNDNGVWVPIKYTGSHGTNGFYLEFKQTGTSQNSSGIGADTSGNDNHWAVTNLAATDITEDTCTNNFATMLPILYNNDVVAFSEGNLKLVGSSSADGGGSWASIVPTSGKWYAEVKLPDAATTQVGFATVDTWSDARNMLGNGTFLYAQNNNTAIKLRQGGSTANASVSGGSNSYSTYSDDTIINLALDMDNGKAYFGINGTYMNSSNPANGTNSFSLHTDYTSGVTFACGLDAATAEWNFGNPPFSISSGNNDGKYGNFEYAVPSGYYALCTKRLAEFG